MLYNIIYNIHVIDYNILYIKLLLFTIIYINYINYNTISCILYYRIINKHYNTILY